MKNIRIYGVGCLITAGVFLAGGCGLMNKITNIFTVTPPPPTGGVYSTIQPEDIPVHPSFAYQPEESIYLVDGNIRTASLKYVATKFVTSDDVINFYERCMTDYGWKQFGAGVSTSRQKIRFFVKEDRLGLLKKEMNEICEVTVEVLPEGTNLTIKINQK